MAEDLEPLYRLTDDNLKITNVAIKGYTKKTNSSFPREEYYAFKIVAVGKYIKDGDNKSTDDGEENKDGERTADAEDDSDVVVKSKYEVASEHTASKPDDGDVVKPNDDDDDDDIIKEKIKGAVVYKKGTTNQYFWETWRRYSEFDLLRNFLQTVYPHVVIPPMPEKKFQGNATILNKITTGEDYDFLTRRAQALEVFLLRVMRHPELCRNKWFHEFLYMADWKENILLSGYKEIQQAESTFRSFVFSSSSKTTDSRFEDVKSYSQELEAVLTALLQIREMANNKLKMVHKLHSDLAKASIDLSEIETTLGACLQAAAGNMDAYSDLVDIYLEEEELRYMLPLKQYQSYCEALRAVVRKQELLQYKLDKCESQLFNKADEKDRLQKKGESGGGGGFSLRRLAAKLRGEDTSHDAMMEQVDKELKDADTQLKHTQEQLDKFAEAAMTELTMFNTQKVADFRSMLINYVQLQMHLHRQGMNIWERLRQAFETSSLRLT